MSIIVKIYGQDLTGAISECGRYITAYTGNKESARFSGIYELNGDCIMHNSEIIGIVVDPTHIDKEDGDEDVQ